MARRGLSEGLGTLDVLGYSGISLCSTSESGAVGASRSPRLNEKATTSERWGVAATLSDHLSS